MPTADEVTVVLQAKTDTYLRNIKNAEQQFVKGLDRIENEANQAGAALGRVGTIGAVQMSRGLKSIDGQLVQAGRRFGAAGQQVGNLGAQINDIGVQLASGQSPFLIAIQQGSQINQVIGQAGAAGAVRALGASFASLVNPVSLATFAIIGLGGAAIQYLTTILSNTAETEESLKSQADLIHRVAERWGEALPALRAYSDELKRQQDLADRTQAVQATINHEFEQLESILPGLRDVAAEVSAELIGMGESTGANQIASNLGEAETAIREYQAALRSGDDTTDEFARVQDALATFMSNGFVQGNNKAIESLQDLANAFSGAAQAAERLRASNAAQSNPDLKGRLGSDAGPPALSDTDFARRFGWGEYFNFKTTEPGGGGGGGGSRGGSTSAINSEREAVERLIEQLEFERSLIGLSAVEKEKANALRRAGVDATSEEGRKIASLTETIYNENAAIKAQEQAFQQLEQIGVDAVSSIADAFSDGKLEAEELIGILVRVGQQLLQLKSVGGSGGGGGFFANILGALIPGFADGTNSAPGGLAWVGEKGPELVNLPRGSQVIPNHRLGGGGGTSVVINAPINAPGADAAQLARVEQSVKDLARNVPKMVDNSHRHPKHARHAGIG